MIHSSYRNSAKTTSVTSSSVADNSCKSFPEAIERIKHYGLQSAYKTCRRKNAGSVMTPAFTNAKTSAALPTSQGS